MKDTNEVFEQNEQLVQEAILKVENPLSKGMYLTVWNDQISMVRPDPYSGRLSRYEVTEISVEAQFSDGSPQHIDKNKFINSKLCIFLFNADFGPKTQGSFSLLPQEPGSFQVFSFQQGTTKPIFLSASVDPVCQLDLTAIGIANRTSTAPFGLRAIFPGNNSPFGVVAITTCREVISMWYWEELGGSNSHTPSENDDNIDSFNLLTERNWRDGYDSLN